MVSDCPLNGSKLFAAIYFLCLCLIVHACGKKLKIQKVDPAFSKYIEAYTSGTISKNNSIRIRLAQHASTTHSLNEAVKEELFGFSPAVAGKSYWTDAHTIEFKPEKPLKPDQLYEVRFKLGKVTTVPEEFREFRFAVQTIKPSFVVREFGLKAVDNSHEKMILTGEIESADVEEGKTFEEIFTATLNKEPVPIKWVHNESARIHAFTVQSINRGQSRNELQLNWDGAPLNISIKDNKILEVPAIGDFKVLSVRAVQDAENYALVQFSDPLAINQDLTGLIAVAGKEEPAFSISGSEVKVYVNNEFDGNYTVSVNPGIQNVWQQKMKQTFSASIYFENRLPSVKINGHGVIMPNTGKLVLPFETINLIAVDVSILKIYENNIPQFLQNNGLEGLDDLRRVAKPVVQATIRLDNDNTLDLHRKQRFSLDIDKYLKTEPGAIYRVTMGFRPEYSLYICTDTTSRGGDEEEEEEDSEWVSYFQDQNGFDEDNEFWDRYDTYYPYGYNWRQRGNPCHRAYFNKEKWATRNVLASNIGLTVKRGNDNSMLVAVTNILTTEPITGVELELLDYQHQVIHKTKSGGDGLALFDLKRKPFMLIAKKETERGYLKLDDGNALPLSRFDVAGEKINQGIKGFIFGERGVWRPGDTMFLSFIAEDETKQLPADHPVQFELFTPKGQLYKSVTETKGTNGFYVFKTATDPGSPTGSWLARIKVGGAVFEKRIKIETIMPNRLKIDLNFGKEAMIGKNAVANGTLSARWLFGATAQNLKAKIDASLYARKTIFKKFGNYHFDNPASGYTTETQSLFDGKLSSEGTAPVNVKFDLDHLPPGMLSANLLVKVFEPGGAFSIDNVVLPYSPFESYVGIQLPKGQAPWGFLLTNKEYRMDIVQVDPRGNPLTGKSEVQVELYRVQWRWWWDNSGEDLSNFTQESYNKVLKKEKIEITDGTGNWSFSAPGAEWGRYLLLVRDLKSGHVTGQTIYFDDPYWQTRSTNEPSAAAMLSFTSDKEKYQVDDKVNLTIPSSKGGRALISIETGSKVLRTQWVQTEQGQTKYSFKAEKDMSPNVYVNVSLLQPHSQTANDLPIRMYGVLPIIVEDRNTILKPVIDMPASIKPEQPVAISVWENSGREMTYSIAIVDEGLLDLTRFKTPDPHNAFYAKEALGVKSWDMFDQVLGAWGTELERILTIGGDEETGGPSKQKTANRFKPVVKYLGPFKSEKRGKQTHQFTLPQYIGSVRVMVIAAQDGSYGFAEKAVPVKKPLMLLATLPRVLGPSENIQLPVTIFAMENNIRSAEVRLQNNPFLEVSGPSAQTVSFSTPGEQMIYFNVNVKSSTGIGKVKLIATSGNEKAEYDVELDIRNPNPAVTRVDEMELSPGKNWKTIARPIGVPANSKATLEISSIPSMNLAKRLSYLIQYPHGCVEQVTSSVFPQLVISQLTDLDDRRKAEIDRNIRAAIEKLKNFQRPEGGFSYWPGERESDEWGTNYAGHFLLEAETRGYYVSADMLQSWKNFQRTKANGWVPSSRNFYGGDLSQAYRLYLLALAKTPEQGAMNRLKEFEYLSPEAKWRLAATYQLAGQNNIALQLVNGLPVSFENRQSPGFTYGSELRDLAMVLESLTLMNNRGQADELVKTIAAKLAQDSWYSTQTTAYSLLAIAKYCGKNPAGVKIQANGNINGQNFNLSSPTYLSQLPIPFRNGNPGIDISNKGTNTLYARLITEGQPLSGDAIPVVNNPNTLILQVTYHRLDGQVIEVGQMKQGTDFVAKVILKNPGKRGNYSEMALSQVFPSGWEILNTRLLDYEGSFKSSSSSYQDFRDDRVYTYFDMREGEILTFYVMLNAAYPGRFYLPGTYCEAMYDNSISAGTDGRWVEIKN
jgi:alpha-2-macroglobulin